MTVLLYIAALVIVLGSFMLFKKVLETELGIAPLTLKTAPFGTMCILLCAALAIPGMLVSCAAMLLDIAVWLLILI